MNTHLTDEDFAAAVAGHGVSSQASEHLSSCVSCRQQVAEMQRSIAGRRQAMEAEFPGWQHQRQNVMARLADASQTDRPTARRWLRPVLAAAAALVVAVGIRLAMPPEHTAPPVTNNLPIEQILAEVDAMLADDSLPGFESIDFGFDDPASLFENGSS